MRTYRRRTKNDLVFHPLAAVFQSCNDPGVALSVFQRAAHRPRINDEDLKKLLGPTLTGLYSLSPNLKDGVGLVIVDLVLSPEKAILVAFGVLVSVAQASRASMDRLNDIFISMAKFFDNLPPDPSVNTSENIMLEILSILTITTVAIKQGATRMNLKPFKQRATKNEVDKALQRLDISALRKSEGVTAESSRPDGTPTLDSTLALDGTPALNGTPAFVG
ncbi:hypothetical protein BJV77DRAFT_963822 [Russula vinacea]|nr:hypothetical protein BJV77DRAFT_963822 [Russula vinacea]